MDQGGADHENCDEGAATARWRSSPPRRGHQEYLGFDSAESISPNPACRDRWEGSRTARLDWPGYPQRVGDRVKT